jgi:tRNA modification GTPase
VQVAIIGQPNAGKSTLLNALLNENRAIVSDVAGTTRDTIEEVLNIEGVLFRLVDTAGIRQDTQDEIEAIGVGRSLDKMRTADLVLYLFDSSQLTAAALDQAMAEVQQENKQCLWVANKWDLCSPEQQKAWQEHGGPALLPLSAKNKEGLPALKKALLDKAVHGNIQTESTVVTNARHQEALLRLSQSLQEVSQGLADGIPGDLLALDIRQCLHHLGTITGQITHEDQLDFIFSKFCIGK